MAENTENIYEVDLEIRNGFIDESLDDLASAAKLISDLQLPLNIDRIQQVFRIFHSIKGNAPYFSLKAIQRLAHGLENILDDLRKERVGFSEELKSNLLAGCDALTDCMENARNNESEVTNQVAFNALLARITQPSGLKERQKLLNDALRLSEDIAAAPEVVACPQLTTSLAQLTAMLSSLGGAVAADVAAAAPEEDVAENDEEETPSDSVIPDDESPDESDVPHEDAATTRTMRIKESSIDAFLKFVGELIVVEEMYDNLCQRSERIPEGKDLTENLRRINKTFNELSANLQKSIMEIRLIPIGSLLQRCPKTIREIADVSDKKIDVIITGADIKVDKALIETLEAPLIHMIRNAADHGVETREDRLAAGKSENGTITIRVADAGKMIALTIEDDGQGIDLDALADKAIELGIIRDKSAMTHDALVHLMFRSGVSTSEVVSDVSGRGVGMDVVKRNIEQAGGNIQIDTTPGQGSVFAVHMPKSVTTQIINGFVIICNKTRYIIPLEKIDQSYNRKDVQISSMAGKGLIAKSGDAIYPVHILADVLQHTSSHPKSVPDNGVLITVFVGKKQHAIYVDTIEGIRQVVLKDIGLGETYDRFFHGGAVMGDGSVALVLNLDELLM